MDILIGFLMVLETIVCLLLILIVLMQRPRQEGLGAAFGSGMTDQMFGAHTTNVLQKGTTWLGIFFFVLTFFLAIIVAHQDTKKASLPKLVDEADKKAVPTAPANMPKSITDALEALKAEDAKKAADKTAVPAPTTTAPAAKSPAPATPTPPAPESKAPALTPPAPVPGTAPTPPPAPAVQPAPKTGN